MSSNRRVLIADDSETTRLFLAVVLERAGYEVAAFEAGDAALEALRRPGGPRLAVLDWMMPGLDGLELCRRIRERVAPYVYALLLTARDRKEDLLEALEAGADDFVAKPPEPRELVARLDKGRRILDLQDALLEAQDTLRFEARHDPLTGAMNRAAIETFLRIELRRARNDSTPLAVALLDFDRFKAINDGHGHAAGDAVLAEGAAPPRRRVSRVPVGCSWAAR